MHLVSHRTVNVVSVYIDNKIGISFDSNQWYALLELAKELKD